MKEVFKLPAEGVKMLCWERDGLSDPSCGLRYHFDGRRSQLKYCWPNRFDGIAISPSGTFSVLYERLDTKGVIRKNGEVWREINRSYHHASIYDYPVTLFALPDGREVIAHCPEDTGTIHIEDLETGERLTSRKAENHDYFHSRLQASSGGRLLLSAGWAWGSRDIILLFDVEAALMDPKSLDGDGLMPSQAVAEIMSADFLGNHIVATGGEEDDQDDPETAEYKVQLRTISLLEIPSGRVISAAPRTEELGTILTVDKAHILSLYRHPKLVEIQTGKILRRWENLHSGEQISSLYCKVLPPMCFDSARKLFAVADAESISIIDVTP